MIIAFMRLIKAVLVAIIMMPSKFFYFNYIKSINILIQKSETIGLSYSLMGRQCERMDNAYACYTGFLHMYI